MDRSEKRAAEVKAVVETELPIWLSFVPLFDKSACRYLDDFESGYLTRLQPPTVRDQVLHVLDHVTLATVFRTPVFFGFLRRYI